MSSLEISFLQAFNGDCIHLRIHDDMEVNRNIIIDGGIAHTYNADKRYSRKEGAGSLFKLIEDITKSKNEKIDLLVVTHIDLDHIGGIIKWFESDEFDSSAIQKIWFNSGNLISKKLNHPGKFEDPIKLTAPVNRRKMGFKEGIELQEYIEQNKKWESTLIHEGQSIELFGFYFHILSPTVYGLKNLLENWETFKKKRKRTKTTRINKENNTPLKEFFEVEKWSTDTSPNNDSSIAFVMTDETWTNNWFFLADAHPETIVKSLDKLGYSPEHPIKSRLLKLSHHGSKANTTIDLLKTIKTDHYVICTNGRYGHPSKQCLASIRKYNPEAKFYFTYPSIAKSIFLEEDYKYIKKENLNDTVQSFNYKI